MKKLIMKISTWAFMLGLFVIGFNLWDIYKERNINSEAISIEANDIVSSNTNKYSEVVGGRLDITNMYELSLTTKRSDSKLTSDFYIPVLNSENDSLLYILKTPLAPTAQEFSGIAKYKGLLKDKAELSTKILDAYNQSFNNAKFVFLDSTYKPETLMEKIINLKVFLYLLIGGLIGMFLCRSKQPKPITVNEE